MLLLSRLHDEAGEQAGGGQQEGHLHQGPPAQDGRPPHALQVKRSQMLHFFQDPLTNATFFFKFRSQMLHFSRSDHKCYIFQDPLTNATFLSRSAHKGYIFSRSAYKCYISSISAHICYIFSRSTHKCHFSRFAPK